MAHYFTPDEITNLSTPIDPHVPCGLEYCPPARPGERFPINDPALEPRLTLRPESEAVFLQAMSEGIARVEARCCKEIASGGGTYPDILYSTDGDARKKVFGLIRRDAMGLDLSQAA